MTALLQVKDLKKYFPIRGGILNRVVNNVQAVNDVSFDVRKGEVVGLVGESGSGRNNTYFIQFSTRIIQYLNNNFRISYITRKRVRGNVISDIQMN